MSRYCWIAIVFFFLASCSDNAEPVPLGNDELVDALIDIHLAEALLQEAAVDHRDSLANLYYDRILSRHNISREDFDQSMLLLRERPDRMEKIYTRVMDSLSVREVTLSN